MPRRRHHRVAMSRRLCATESAETLTDWFCRVSLEKIITHDGGVTVVNIINKSSTESPEKSNGSYISGVEVEVGSVVVAEQDPAS